MKYLQPSDIICGTEGLLRGLLMSSDAIGGPLAAGVNALSGGALRPSTPAIPKPGAAVDDAALMKVAREFEATFLAEMLKYAGLEGSSEAMSGTFGGGHGERAFKSLLTREYADALSQQGRLGLAEQIYADLKRKVAPHAE